MAITLQTPKQLVQFQLFRKNSLVQINSKLNSKPYDYLTKRRSLLHLTKRMIAPYLACKCSYPFCFCSEPMSSMGNAFVVCGVIYCIHTYNSKSTAINFAYDTKTGTKWNPTYSSQTCMVTTPWWTTTPEKKCCTLRTKGAKLLTLLLSRNQANRETGKHRKGKHFRLLCCFVEDAFKSSDILLQFKFLSDSPGLVIIISVNTTLISLSAGVIIYQLISSRFFRTREEPAELLNPFDLLSVLCSHKTLL